MDDISSIDRATRAQKLLQDPLLADAFEKVRLAILSAFESSPARDAEGREHLFQRLKALNDARGYLEQAVRDGKVVVHLQEEKRRFSLFR